MMDRLRAASGGVFGRFVMIVILGLIVVSFGFWGIGDVFSGFTANELAKVGTSRISVDAYRTAYQGELQRLEGQLKRGITNDEARQIGLDRQVLARLLTDAVLDQEVKRLGLAVSDADVATMIRKDDSFKGPSGQFDKVRFDYLLRNNDTTESAYIGEQRRTYLRQLVSNAVIGGVEAPRAMSLAIHRYQNETRAIDYIDLPATVAGDIAKPTDAELQRYFDERKRFFRAPEYRKLVTLAVIPADLVKPADVSDADVQKRYDETKAERFISPEKRTLQQIVFPDQAAATAAKTKLDGGETFAALAAERKLTDKDIDLGTVTKADLAEKPVAEAAFALPPDGTSQPVKTAFGAVLVHVGKIIPQTQTPLMQVSAQLKDEIAIVRAKAQAVKLRDKIEDQRSAGKTLTEAAASVGLKPKTIDAIDVDGRDKANKPVEGLVDGPALLKAAFASDVGADTDMISTDNGGYAWYEVAGVEPARQLTLADVRPRVEAAWRKDEIAKRLTAKTDALSKAIDDGKALSAIAKETGNLQVEHTGDVKRGGSSALTPSMVTAVFSTRLHKAGSAATPTGGRILFQVVDAVVPPMGGGDDEFKKTMQQVQGSFLDDVLTQYLTALELHFGVKVNAKAVAATIGGDAENGS